MADPLLIIVTDAGRAALVNAEHTGTAPVLMAEIGLSDDALVALPGMVALPGEFKRVAAISGLVVAADTIHVTMFDDSADAYELRSMALYLDDGTLFALYGQADPILEKTASSIAALAVDVVFADIAADTITFGDVSFVNPPATEATMGVVELADEAEANAGVLLNRALSPARARAAVLGWLLDQDGAGSLLDADRLDGQEGAWYADIAARLGYVPLPAASFTAGQILAMLLTVDGTTSLLDADKLDGQEGAYYANIAARLGFTPLDAALFTAAQILARLITVDGSGSGLDADLLDGLHASAFARANEFLTGTGATGRWWRQPDGGGGSVLIQQGFAGPMAGPGATVIALPTPHASLDYNVQLTTAVPGAGDYDNYFQEVKAARTLNSITVLLQDPSSGGLANVAGVNWSTRGY